MFISGVVFGGPSFDRKPVEQLVGSVGDLDYTGSFDFRDVCAPVKRQPDEQCVGASLASNAYDTSKLAGVTIEYPSGEGTYTIAREIDRGVFNLPDRGCRAEAALEGMARFGLVSESRWRSDGWNTFEPVAWDVFQAGSDALVPDTAVLSLNGDEAVRQMRAGFKKAKPLLSNVVIPVYAAFQNYGTGVYDSTEGSILGWHMMESVGFNEGLDAFLFRQTWGYGWGMGGYGYISRRLIADPSFCVFRCMLTAPVRGEVH